MFFKKILLLSLLFLSFNASSQKYTEYYDNGQLKVKGKYKNDTLRVGEWNWYYENGKVLKKKVKKEDDDEDDEDEKED
jgi:antitoxin component YwqK of YwqJK toxin-antitoxin module